MSQAKPVGTQADRALIEHAAQHGVGVTPGQLKRWRTAGLLPTPARTAHGRGQGRTSDAYPPDAFTLVVPIARLVAEGNPLREVALWLYLSNAPVNVSVVRRSFTECVQWVCDRVDTTTDEDAADHLAQRILPELHRRLLGRMMIAKAGTYGARQGSLGEALAAMMGQQFGPDSATQEGLEVVASLTGLTDPDDIAALVGALSSTTLNMLSQTLDNLSDDDLRDACDRCCALGGHLARMIAPQVGMTLPELRKHFLKDGSTAMLCVVTWTHFTSLVPGLHEKVTQALASLEPAASPTSGEPPPHDHRASDH